MTGKELKEFAAKVPDECTIRVRERSYGNFEERFEMQASLEVKFPKEEVESVS